MCQSVCAKAVLKEKFTMTILDSVKGTVNTAVDTISSVAQTIVEKKRTKTNMAYSVCMAFITVVFVISLFAQYQVKLDLNAQEKDVKVQLSQQEKIKKRLTNEADNQDSPEVIEKIAREKLNMVKPNAIVFVDDNQDENTTSSPLTTTSASTSDGE